MSVMCSTGKSEDYDYDGDLWVIQMEKHPGTLTAKLVWVCVVYAKQNWIKLHMSYFYICNVFVGMYNDLMVLVRGSVMVIAQLFQIV